MPVLVNPYLSFGGGAGPVDLTEQWGEVARQETISAGKLTISGLDLSGIQVCRVLINGVTVTTDNTQIFLRLHIGGSEVSASAYRYSTRRLTTSVDDIISSGSGIDVTEIPLSSSASSRGVGNASTEGFGADLVLFGVSGSLYKRGSLHTWYTKPDGVVMSHYAGTLQLADTGAVTGLTVYGDSDLTGGSVVVLGVE